MSTKYQYASRLATHIIDTDNRNKMVLDVPMKWNETEDEWRDRQAVVLRWLQQGKIVVDQNQ